MPFFIIKTLTLRIAANRTGAIPTRCYVWTGDPVRQYYSASHQKQHESCFTRHLQAWRLLMPVFLHVGIVHLLFNVLFILVSDFTKWYQRTPHHIFIQHMGLDKEIKYGKRNFLILYFTSGRPVTLQCFVPLITRLQRSLETCSPFLCTPALWYDTNDSQLQIKFLSNFFLGCRCEYSGFWYVSTVSVFKDKRRDFIPQVSSDQSWLKS